MLRHLIGFSLRHASLVVLLAAIAMIAAGIVLPQMAVDVFPELNAPTVVIMTESGGLAADEVEQYVTFPIEAAVNGLPGVRRVRSGSAISLSIVWVEFEWGYDILRARQLVNERLSIVREDLPDSAHSEMAPISSIAGEVMLVSISSPDGSVDALELRAFAEFDARNRLLAVPGVAQVVAIGGELPEYQVNVRQDRLRLYGLTVQDVVAAAGEAHSIRSAGYIPDHQGRELPIRQSGRVRSVQDIRETLIRYHDGRPVLIGDVADVALDSALQRGTGADGGHPAVIISIQKAPGTNTLALTESIDGALAELENALPDGAVLNTHVFRQADFIDIAVHNVEEVLRDAAIIVSIILVLFLMNVRTTLITLTALPLSLAIATLTLDAMGLAINVMTLGGFAVAIGELVDDAIIDVENVYRRLRENRGLPPDRQKGHVRVIYDASNEIRSSVVFATVIIVIVFVPLLFLQGLEGRFFRPLGIAYIASITASLLVALTVTPALCRYLLRSRRKKGKNGKPDRPERDGFLVRGLKYVYRPTLRIALQLRWGVMALAAVATAASLWLASTFGSSFLPEFNEGTFTVFLMAPPGTSLQESDRLARGVEQRLTQIEGVRHVARRTGRAERDEHAEPVSSSEIEVTVQAGHDRQTVRRAIDRILGEVPGITTMIGQPIEHRLSHILSGTPAAIAINVYGEDLDTLREIAKEVEGVLESISGTRDVNAMREVTIDSLPVDYRHEDLATWGLTPEMAAGQVSNAFYGAVVDTVSDGIRRYDLVVRLAPDERGSPRDLAALHLRGINGAVVRLDEVATVGIERTSNLITRQNARRKAVISCNVDDGYNLGHLVSRVREQVEPIVEQHGYSVEFGGQFEAQQSASRTILVMGAGVMVVIAVLLQMAFGSMRAALVVMVNLPLALIGGVVAIFIADSADPVGNLMALIGMGEGRYIAPVISIASMVGFVTLFGIAVRNGILLVNHYQHLAAEGVPPREAILRGSEERLVPILMTALTAVLGLVPLAMKAGAPGSELLAPLAIVVLGGLVTSTLLNLIVVPAGCTLLPDSVLTPSHRAGGDPLGDDPDDRPDDGPEGGAEHEPPPEPDPPGTTPDPDLPTGPGGPAQSLSPIPNKETDP